MAGAVQIKIVGSGIKVLLDETMDFEILIKEIALEFEKRSVFFGDKPVAISFENRKLTIEDELKITDVIMKHTDLKVVMIQDEDPVLEKKVNELYQSWQGIGIDKSQETIITKNQGVRGYTDFYRGNLRSGQVLESDSSVTIIGDVNPGAKIISNGNIVILGSLKGYAHAGADGNQECFIFALEMKPIQLQIGDLIAKSPDKERTKRRFIMKEKNASNGYASQLAMVQDGYICIELITKETLNQL